MFELHAVDLLALKTIVIGHDGRDTKSDWYLEEVKVKVIAEGSAEAKIVKFPAMKWLKGTEQTRAQVQLEAEGESLSLFCLCVISNEQSCSYYDQF
jgi:hypothetical protein